jgi:hypothetical protein
MRESRSYGSVRGALSNERPYRVGALAHDPEKCVAVSLATNAERLCGDHAQSKS